jgi:hypothetical protein
MQHTLRFRACDDGSVPVEERTLAYGLACGYERGAAELGVLAGRRVRMELLDDSGRLLDWRTYVVSMTGGPFPTLLPGLAAAWPATAIGGGLRAGATAAGRAHPRCG